MPLAAAFPHMRTELPPFVRKRLETWKKLSEAKAAAAAARAPAPIEIALLGAMLTWHVARGAGRGVRRVACGAVSLKRGKTRCVGARAC